MLEHGEKFDKKKTQLMKAGGRYAQLYAKQMGIAA